MDSMAGTHNNSPDVLLVRALDYLDRLAHPCLVRAGNAIPRVARYTADVFLCDWDSLVVACNSALA